MMVLPRRLSSTMRALAMRREADHGRNEYSGMLLDVSLIILRRRIYEMKTIERNYEAPVEWMDREKSFYTSYNSMAFEIVGILQSMLMNTRPGIALGMIALVILSVPTSTLMAMLYLMKLTNGILAGIHLG